jgi:predicted transposase YdaD
MLERIVDLAEQIPDEGQRIFTLSGVIVASDKFINRDYMDQIRRRINMTQLGQLYEKEKIEYANQKVRENDLKRAKSLLNEGIDIVKIMKTYGFTEEELLHLQDENVTV